MGIRKSLYTGTLMVLLGPTLVGSSSNYSEPATMKSFAVNNAPRREVYIMDKDNVLSTAALEGVIASQYAFLTNSDDKHRLTPKKRAVMDMDYILRKVYTESNNMIDAKSSSDARGLLQIKKGAWKDAEKHYDFRIYCYVPPVNMRVGLKYLIGIYDFLEQNHPTWDALDKKEKQDLMSAAYHGGPTGLMNNNFDISKTSEKTQRYVWKMQKRYPIILKGPLAAYKNSG